MLMITPYSVILTPYCYLSTIIPLQTVDATSLK